MNSSSIECTLLNPNQKSILQQKLELAQLTFRATRIGVFKRQVDGTVTRCEAKKERQFVVVVKL
jgi:hypothetical protein